MAAITSSNVTLLRSWMTTSHAGEQKEKTSDLAISLNGQGATVSSNGNGGDIPAAALGFAKLYYAQCFGGNTSQTSPYSTSNDVQSDVAVFSDNAGLYVASLSTGAPANFTGTLFVRVTGTPKL